jgi:hypothetical protein
VLPLRFGLARLDDSDSHGIKHLTYHEPADRSIYESPDLVCALVVKVVINKELGLGLANACFEIIKIKDEQLKEGDVCRKSFPTVHLCFLVLANDNRDSQ